MTGQGIAAAASRRFLPAAVFINRSFLIFLFSPMRRSRREQKEMSEFKCACGWRVTKAFKENEMKKKFLIAPGIFAGAKLN